MNYTAENLCEQCNPTVKYLVEELVACIIIIIFLSCLLVFKFIEQRIRAYAHISQEPERNDIYLKTTSTLV